MPLQWRIQGGPNLPRPPLLSADFIFYFFGRGIKLIWIPAPPPPFHRSWIRLCIVREHLALYDIAISIEMMLTGRNVPGTTVGGAAHD